MVVDQNSELFTYGLTITAFSEQWLRGKKKLQEAPGLMRLQAMTATPAFDHFHQTIFRS